MACVDSFYQSGYQQHYDVMALRQNPLPQMNKSSTSMLRAAQEVKLVDVRIYESQQQQPTQSKYPSRNSFVKRCSQIATGRRPSITSAHSAQQASRLAQWVQRLPSDSDDYEMFLENALEEAVGQLVCGPTAAAEEVELVYNYDILEDVSPEDWVRVRAQLVECQAKSWIVASVRSKVEPHERPAVYAYGRWMLVKTRRHH